MSARRKRLRLFYPFAISYTLLMCPTLVFAETTSYRIKVLGQEYAIEDCSIYKLSGNTKDLEFYFPTPVDEIRQLYVPLSVFNQARHAYDCSLSTAITAENIIWFGIDGNDWESSRLGGVAFFDITSKKAGVFHPPALVDCQVDGIRISSNTLYVSTFRQYDSGRGRCAGIVSINMDRGDTVSYAQAEAVENLPNILEEIIATPSNDERTPQIENIPPDEEAHLKKINLKLYMSEALQKEFALKTSLQGKSHPLGESFCEISENNRSCRIPLSGDGRNIDFMLGGIPAGAQAALLLPGIRINICPWGSNAFSGQDTCINPKKGMTWLTDDSKGFVKVTLENHKSHFVRLPKENKERHAFENLKIRAQEFRYPAVETKERAEGLVISREQLISSINLPVDLKELLSSLILKEESDHKTALLKLEQTPTNAKNKLLPALIAALGIDEYTPRRYAWFTLAKLGDLAVPALKNELASQSELAQEGAMNAIAIIGLPYAAEVIPELINMLKNGGEEVSQAAYYALQKSGPTALQPLIELFDQSDNTKTKIKVLEIISELKSPDTRQFLKAIALNGDEDIDVRKTAAEALLYTDNNIPATWNTLPIFELALRYSGIIPDRWEDRLVAAGATAVPSLIEALTEENAAHESIRILERIGPAAKAAAPKLKELVNNSTTPYISEAAIAALISMGENPGKAAVPVLAKKIQTQCERDDPTCNEWAIRLLGDMRGDARAAIPALRAILHDYVHGMYAASALAKIAPELKNEYFEILVRALDNEVYIKDSETGGMKWMYTGNSIDYATIIESISEFGPAAKEAAPKIERFLNSDLPYEKEAAEKALKRIAGTDSAPSATHPSKALQEEFAANENDIANILAKIRNASDDAIPIESDALAIIQKVELMGKAGHLGGYDILNKHFRECSWRRPDAQLYEYILQHLYYSDSLLPTVMLGLEKLTTPDIYRGCSYFDMTHETLQPKRYSSLYVNAMIKAMARIDLPDYAYKPCRQAVKSQILNPETKQDFMTKSYPSLSANEKLLADKILQ